MHNILNIKVVIEYWVDQISILIIVFDNSFIFNWDFLTTIEIDKLIISVVIIKLCYTLKTTTSILVIIFPLVSKHSMVQF